MDRFRRWQLLQHLKRWRAEGWIFLVVCGVFFFNWEDWRGRISKSCWIFLLLFVGRCCNFHEFLVIFIPVLCGELISQFDTQHFSFKKLASNNWPYLEPHFFFSDVSNPGFFAGWLSWQCSKLWLLYSWNATLGFSRVVLGYFHGDWSLIRRKLEEFFFATNFLIAYRICRNLGNIFRNQKKKHTNKHAFLFSDVGEETLKKHEIHPSSIDFGDTTIGMDVFC